MKILLVFAFFIIYGCIPLQNTTKPISIIEVGLPIVGAEKTIVTGDIFFEFTRMGEIYDKNNFKYKLSAVEISKDKIGLQYSEYFYGRSGWLIKSGFTTRYDYPAADNKIKFKGYEFEILSVESGGIKYKRIK